jgi:hypothetical protein
VADLMTALVPLWARLDITGDQDPHA